jgi:hypothetical protein
MNFLKGELIEIIEWTDDSRDTLSFRFPDDDKAIKNGAQLIVRESQQVQFVYLGEFGDTFGPGKHTLTTDNIPILTRLKSWKYGLQLAVQGRRLLRQHAALHRQQVGHGQPDHDARQRSRRRARARVRHLRLPHRRREAVPEGGRRVGPQLPARRVRRHHALADRQRVRRRAGLGQRPGVRRREPVRRAGRGAAPAHQPRPRLAKYGLEITSFIIENVSVPPEVEQAIDKRSSMAAVGNLNDYVKFQMAQGMEKGGSSGGMATELAVGLSIAQQIMQQQGMGPPGGPAASSGAPALPDLLSPADAAGSLGVPEPT